jgi:hypothetical protein
MLLSVTLSSCCPAAVLLQVIGTIDGSGRVRLVDKQAEPGTPTPVDLNLDQVGAIRRQDMCQSV